MRHFLVGCLRDAGQAVSACLLRALGNHPAVVGVAGTAVALAMAALTLVTLYEGRGEALARAKETSANLVNVVAGDLARNMQIYDLSLQGMAHIASSPQFMGLPESLRRDVLFERLTTASYVGGAYLIDASGKIFATQNPVDTPVDLSDRDYFTVQRDRADAGLYISHPYRSRLRDGRLSVGLSRRLNGPDGAFAGVALIGIPAAYFQRLVDAIDTGPSGSALIVLNDGTLLGRRPLGTIGVHAGLDLSASPTFPNLLRANSGSYVAHGMIDGVERLYTFAHVAGMPLIVVVSPAVSDVLAPWRHRSLAVGSGTLVLGAVFIVLSWSLAFTLRDKLNAQAELQRLAATDPLTGLSNRRVLDLWLDDEWARAKRENRPVSALFIDVDHFKLYNDHYGHPAGDRVLAAIAACIQYGARRSVDLVARYGGEEFAVVLPGAAAADARRVADGILSAVSGLRVAHEKSAFGIVTVSIGCATALPARDGSGADLLAVADQQLYAAKTGGRNRVSQIDAPQVAAALKAAPA